MAAGRCSSARIRHRCAGRAGGRHARRRSRSAARASGGSFAFLSTRSSASASIASITPRVIEEKFLAIERLLECYPEYRERFVFAQLAAPSRETLPAYRDLRAHVLAARDRVNARFGSANYTPIILLEEHHTQAHVNLFLRAADFCYVGSLHEGMNLVAKEFVSARDDERGVLAAQRLRRRGPRTDRRPEHQPVRHRRCGVGDRPGVDDESRGASRPHAAHAIGGGGVQRLALGRAHPQRCGAPATRTLIGLAARLARVDGSRAGVPRLTAPRLHTWIFTTEHSRARRDKAGSLRRRCTDGRRRTASLSCRAPSQYLRALRPFPSKITSIGCAASVCSTCRHVDDCPDPVNKTTGLVIGGAIKVHSVLGPGLLRIGLRSLSCLRTSSRGSRDRHRSVCADLTTMA